MNFAYLLDAFFTLVYSPLTFLLNISILWFFWKVPYRYLFSLECRWGQEVHSKPAVITQIPRSMASSRNPKVGQRESSLHQGHYDLVPLKGFGILLVALNLSPHLPVSNLSIAWSFQNDIWNVNLLTWLPLIISFHWGLSWAFRGGGPVCPGLSFGPVHPVGAKWRYRLQLYFLISFSTFLPSSTL